MATKTEKKPVASKPTVVKIGLDEFCARLSESLKRPELIGAFEFVERRAGRINGTEQDFQGRFDAFVNTPV